MIILTEELTAGLEKLRLASSDPTPDLFDQLLRQLNALGQYWVFLGIWI